MLVPVEGRLGPPVVRAEAGTTTSPWRWMLLLVLLPFLLLSGAGDDVEERLDRTLDRHPKAKRRWEETGSIEETLARIPGKKIDGAWLARDSALPWSFAFAAAVVFLGAFRLVVPRGRATWRQLLAVGTFTGTVGIFILLAFQVGAMFQTTLGAIIGIMYIAATHPGSGFWACMIGMTFGVGLCEELCKSTPLIWRFRRASGLDVRGAAAWGMASGIGFGISEGVHYATESYNGLAAGSLYLVRFLSCVPLHGAWAGTAAILLWQRQAEMADFDDWRAWIRSLFVALIGPMLLHALYNSLLHVERPVLATAVAAGSFTWFLWLYGRADRIEARA